MDPELAHSRASAARDSTLLQAHPPIKTLSALQWARSSNISGERSYGSRSSQQVLHARCRVAGSRKVWQSVSSCSADRGTHPSNITKYVEYLDEYLEERDIYRKVKEQKHWYNKEKLEKLDRIITMGMLEAEDQCRIHHRQPWSKEVNEVMTTANILRINLSSLTGFEL